MKSSKTPSSLHHSAMLFSAVFFIGLHESVAASFSVQLCYFGISIYLYQLFLCRVSVFSFCAPDFSEFPLIIDVVHESGPIEV